MNKNKAKLEALLGKAATAANKGIEGLKNLEGKDGVQQFEQLIHNVPGVTNFLNNVTKKEDKRESAQTIKMPTKSELIAKYNEMTKKAEAEEAAKKAHVIDEEQCKFVSWFIRESETVISKGENRVTYKLTNIGTYKEDIIKAICALLTEKGFEGMTVKTLENYVELGIKLF